ncbi:MAG: MoxR family ATPase, partial [Verrucomicrobiota bacterium]
PSPFHVLATQNPVEMEGTYPLPEAQLDRFLFKLTVNFPDRAALVEISRRTTGTETARIEKILTGSDLVGFQSVAREVVLAEPLAGYAADLILATHPSRSPVSRVAKCIAYGASPRGHQALVRGARVLALLEGRTSVGVSDLQKIAKPALRHRLLLNFDGEAAGEEPDSLIDELLDSVPTPGGPKSGKTASCHGDESPRSVRYRIS